MTKYTFEIDHPQRQYIQITAEFETSDKETKVFLPAWRPGRYELGDFAKNVNHFRVFNEKESKLSFKKENKNTWIVETGESQKIIVKYSFYANVLNAGSTYLDVNQLYVNPVNCCVFTDETSNEKVSVQLNIPKAWKVATSLTKEGEDFTAENFDELADSPFICSPSLLHETYTVDGVLFHIWFQGEVKPEWEKVLNDFESFSRAQIKRFLKFPTNEYHFLFHILPYRIHHGVEHCKSTVIALGPSYAIFEEGYQEFLGVSSHELYHTWNVKAIRDVEMYPYNFKNENYSELGYITEGVTTYMGDLMLLKAGVFSIEQYMVEMNTLLQRHLDNFGRLNYSVAASSFDTWLDGYGQGVPDRKVSIYTEGALLAFIVDVLTLKNTDNKRSLDDVMRSLYYNFAVEKKGITEKDYQNAIENVSGTDFQWFFNNFVHGTVEYTPLLQECLKHIGFDLKSEPDNSEFAAYLGAVISAHAEGATINSFYPGSPLEIAGVMLGDMIISINGISIGVDAERWAEYFRTDDKTIVLKRNNEIITIHVPESQRMYYQRYFIEPVNRITRAQVHAYDCWRGAELGQRTQV